MRLLSPVSPPEVAQDFDPFHDDVLRTLDRLGAGRLGFDDQNVAVRQHIERARVLQARWPERVDLQAVRDRRLLAFFQPTTDATCIGGKRYCCCAGRSGFAPICVFGSGAVCRCSRRAPSDASGQASKSSAGEIRRRDASMAQLPHGDDRPWSSPASP